jgi:hypothetical protein
MLAGTPTSAGDRQHRQELVVGTAGQTTGKIQDVLIRENKVFEISS